MASATSWSLIQRSITRCVYLLMCDIEISILRNPGPNLGWCTTKKKFMTIYYYFSNYYQSVINDYWLRVWMLDWLTDWLTCACLAHYTPLTPLPPTHTHTHRHALRTLHNVGLTSSTNLKYSMLRSMRRRLSTTWLWKAAQRVCSTLNSRSICGEETCSDNSIRSAVLTNVWIRSCNSW